MDVWERDSQVASNGCSRPTAPHQRSPLQPLHQAVFTSPLNVLLVAALQLFSSHVRNEVLGADVDRAAPDHGVIVLEFALGGK